MTDYWHRLLQQQTALANALNLQSNAYFTPLSHLGILHIVGDDAAHFLQNLLTNDVAALTPDQAQLSGLCNTKGRLFASFILIRQADAYHIILPKNMCRLLQRCLTMYVLRAKVTISDESDRLFCIGLITADHSQINTLQGIKHPIDKQRSLFICQQNTVENLVAKFKKQGLQLAPQNSWQQLDINVGLATILPESKEKFTPQQVNFDLIGGVSFSKGCYPGQEVVARLHYLGKPSRRLFIAEAATDKLPNIADEITTTDGNVAGHIVSAHHVGSSLKLLISLKLTAKMLALQLNGTAIKVQGLGITDE